jgi:hypothetical protein
MNGFLTTRRSPNWTRVRGFSLVEVTLAIGIIVFVLVALIGLLSLGLRHLRESGDRFVTSAIAQDVASELQRYSIRPSFFRDPRRRSLSRLYDQSGILLASGEGGTPPSVPSGLRHLAAYYLAEIELGPLASYPPDVNSDQLLAAVLVIRWPHGEPPSEERTARYPIFLYLGADPAWPTP